MGCGAQLCVGEQVQEVGLKDYERSPETVAGLHFVAFACLMVQRAIGLFMVGP
jgi:hypothetical protein